jgi:6-phosphogluconolactonase
MAMVSRVEISPDPEKQAEFVAQWLIARMTEGSGDFRLVLSGGNTPRLLYRAMATRRRQVPWHRLELYWGDERFVPQDHPASNFRMAFEAWLRDAPIPQERIHPMPVEGTPERAAARYEALLKAAYGADSLDRERPLFDVVLLGLGGDGHTCSLFPDSSLLEEWVRWVGAAERERPEPRITLTYPAIESSRAIAFLVAGADKREVLRRVLAGDRTLPASRVKSAGEVVWFLDRAAAGPRDVR